MPRPASGIMASWLFREARQAFTSRHNGKTSTYPPGGETSRVVGVLCTQCGQTNPESSRFCARCGRALTVAAPRPPVGDELPSTLPHSWKVEPEEGGHSLIGQVGATLEALPPGSALLVVTRGPNAGSRFALETDMTTVGRHSKSDVLLDDVTVSRRHAEFYRRHGVFLVRDLGSLNGTYVNRERVEEVALARGDELQIGKFRLVFLVP